MTDVSDILQWQLERGRRHSGQVRFVTVSDVIVIGTLTASFLPPPPIPTRPVKIKIVKSNVGEEYAYLFKLSS